MLALILSTKDYTEEKSSVYECGFAPVKVANKPFRVRFFTVAILFLVFDLEVVIVFPWSLHFGVETENTGIFFSLFFVVLVAGLFYE